MRKRFFIISLALLIVTFYQTISFAGDFTSSDPYKNSSYNRSNASAYAYNWATSYNTSEFYNAGEDCTNFVS